MNMPPLVAAIDIGKTNARLLLLDADDGRTVWSAERPSPAIASRHPHVLGSELDVHGIEAWLLAQLAARPEPGRIRAIVPVAHGAAFVLADARGRVLAAPDYEDRHFDTLAAAYAAARDPFAATLSPFLPAGLNLGRQIHYLQNAAPALFADAALILTYPQYWAWRFSGVAASELTSLGCHSDLWRPAEGCFSDLAISQGWTALLPPPRPARAVLGPVRADLAAQTGLPEDCAVICGIHDSNASYLAHRIGRPAEARFAVISSGTWCVVMTHGGDLARLREAEDMLANIDALGAPTPTGRFMGGREYAAVAGPEALAVPPTQAGLDAVLAAGALALPSFALAGPFQGRAGRLSGAAGLGAAARAALATLYCALMADVVLERLGAAGCILVDGPLAANPLFAPVLQSLRPADRVAPGGRSRGLAAAVLWLAGGDAAREAPSAATGEMPQAERVRAYRDRWRAMLPMPD